MNRDEENITYLHSVDTLWSGEGSRFQREKYAPKISFLKEYFGGKFPAIKLLDVGIGYGFFLALLEKEHGLRELYGMDPYPNSIEIARRHTSSQIREGNIMDDSWPFERTAFDAITCFDVVEHLQDPSIFFRKAARYLADGGVVVITTPNKGLPYRMRRIPWFGLRDSNPTHIHVRRPGYWKALAAETGYEIVCSWRGEHLTHVRILPRVLRSLCRTLKLDHRRIPVVNGLEQSFCMVIRLAGVRAREKGDVKAYATCIF